MIRIEPYAVSFAQVYDDQFQNARRVLLRQCYEKCGWERVESSIFKFLIMT